MHMHVFTRLHNRVSLLTVVVEIDLTSNHTVVELIQTPL